MARATYARVLVRLGGTRPTGWTEAAITSLCTSADNRINGYTAPSTISTTSDTAIEIAVDVVLRMMRQSDNYRRSTGAITTDGVTYSSNVIVLTDEIKQTINALLNETYYVVTTVDMVE